MPDLHIESVEELAGLTSTLGPYASRHPADALPVAEAIIEAFGVSGALSPDGPRPCAAEHGAGDGCPSCGYCHYCGAEL